MTVPICFLDTETDGVHPDREAWEIAMIRRDDTGQRETSFFVEVNLSTADPFGTVVEDRWGLRWRADIRVDRFEGWRCRSAGLGIWRSDDQLTERGPLLFVRVDRCFAGSDAQVAFAAGKAEDEAMPFDLDEDPEDDPRFVRGIN